MTTDSFKNDCALEPAKAGLQVMELVGAVARWCECLQGQWPLMTALKHLAEGFGAQAVCLTRQSRNSDGLSRSIIFNPPPRGRQNYPVARSYAGCVLGVYVNRPRIASVWFSSLAEEEGDPALKVFQARGNIAETGIVALCIEEKWVDYLEVHFASPVSGGAQETLQMMAETLSRTWSRRSSGLFSEAILASRAQTRTSTPAMPLLAMANPAQLTRAEFRICILLSRGLSSGGILSELLISRSTLKSHMRSIFLKTDTTSQSELLYRLLASPAERTAPVLASFVRRA